MLQKILPKGSLIEVFKTLEWEGEMESWEVHKEPHNKQVPLRILQVPIDCLRFIIRSLQQRQSQAWKMQLRILSKPNFLHTIRRKASLISQMSLHSKTSQHFKSISRTRFTLRKWLLYLSNRISRRSVTGQNQEREEVMIELYFLMTPEIIIIVLKTFLDSIPTGKQGKYQLREIVRESWNQTRKLPRISSYS